MILCSLACAATIFINTSGKPWNDFDKRTYERAKIRCGELYPKSSCVKIFKKWGPMDYSVICTAPKPK